MIDPILSMVVRSDEPEYVKHDDVPLYFADEAKPKTVFVTTRSFVSEHLEEGDWPYDPANLTVPSAESFRLPDARHRCP